MLRVFAFSIAFLIVEGYLAYLNAPEVAFNLLTFVYLYVAQWMMVKPIMKAMERYYGPNGLYVPEEAVKYRFRFKIGNLNVCVFPVGKETENGQVPESDVFALPRSRQSRIEAARQTR